jgi:glycosyltransferase involved in cell wall biosynthesis
MGVANNKVMVSVIMPAYNVEAYIGECLDSVLNQPLQNIEVICVDDASTDRTMDIIESYCKRDKRVKVVSYGKNMGLAYARNRGLEVALGKYIYFLDSDDYVKPMIFTELIDCAEKNNTDCVYFDSEVLDEDDIGFMNTSFGVPEVAGKVLNGKDFFIILQNNNTYRNSVWRQFWSRDFLLKSKIRFIDGSLAEDVYFSTVAILSLDRCVYLNKVLHVYRRHVGTLSRARTPKITIHLFKLYCDLMQFWGSCEFSDEVNKAMNMQMNEVFNSAKRFYLRNKDEISEDDFEVGFERHMYNRMLVNVNINVEFMMTDEEVNELNKAEEIFVYGAGQYATDVVIYLGNNNYTVNGLVVTNKADNIYSINNLPMCDINEFVASHKGAVVVIGVKNRETRKEIIDELHNRNVHNIVDIRQPN